MPWFRRLGMQRVREVVARWGARIFGGGQPGGAPSDAALAKQEFLSVMSHELRTPLTAIVGYTEILDMELVGPLSEEQRVLLARVQDSAHELLRQIEQVLDFARLQGGSADFFVESFAPALLFEQVAEPYLKRAAQKNISLSIHLPRERGVVETDLSAFAHIAGNLLDNSIKFTTSGEVRCVLEPEGADLLLRVSDTGCGIRPDLLPRLFDPFWQANASATRSVGGMGLGLAVVSRLVSGLGGEVWAHSEVGQGTEVRVRLPGAWRRSPDLAVG